MARVTKCIYCEEKDKSEKIKIEISSEKYQYIHELCIPKYEEKQRQQQIENEQRDELYNYLKRLYNAAVIPQWSFSKIQNLKRDNNLTFKMILDAYIIAEDKIKWFMNNVNDNNNASAINAGITLMIKHGINEVYKREKLKQKKEQDNQKMMQQETEKDMSVEIVKSKKYKKDELDISDLL